MAARVEVKGEYLRSFCVAVSEGSITAAAARLGLSQPGVSRHLLLLQRAYGAALYAREGQGIAPTVAGRALLPHACAVAEALDQAHRFLRGESEEGRTRLRFGLSHHLTTRYTGPLLRAARRHAEAGHPLRLHLEEGYTDDLVRAVARGRLDAAYMLEAPEASSGMERTSVGRERVMLLVMSDDPFAHEPRLPLTAVEGETLVVPSSASSVYRLVMDALEGTGTRPGRLLEVSGPAAVRSAIIDGLGIGVTLESFVRPETTSGALRLVEVAEPELDAEIVKLTRAESHLFPDEHEALLSLGAQLGEGRGAGSTR